MVIDRISRLPVIGPIIRHRFSKFGTVGLFGTAVNLIVLFIGQEIIFKDIRPTETRLHLSLGLAILLATINNYLWNRNWTWGDRKGTAGYGFFLQMGQYFVACGLAIAIQFGFTVLLAQYVHYMIANIFAIIIAAVFNYLLNDTWTFSEKVRRKLRQLK